MVPGMSVKGPENNTVRHCSLEESVRELVTEQVASSNPGSVV